MGGEECCLGRVKKKKREPFFMVEAMERYCDLASFIRSQPQQKRRIYCSERENNLLALTELTSNINFVTGSYNLTWGILPFISVCTSCKQIFAEPLVVGVFFFSPSCSTGRNIAHLFSHNKTDIYNWGNAIALIYLHPFVAAPPHSSSLLAACVCFAIGTCEPV